MIHLRHTPSAHPCGLVIGFSAVGCHTSYIAIFYSADKIAEIDRCPLCRMDLYEALRVGELVEVGKAAFYSLQPDGPVSRKNVIEQQALKKEAADEMQRLQSENRTLRIAQKACETCGPNSPRWEDGEAANLEAAGEDAYEWLIYLQARNKTLKMDSLRWEKLDRSIEALRAFMRRNAGVKP